jgi:hypothetical protein
MQDHSVLLEKLLSRTIQSGECLVWQGAIGKATGYGYMWVPTGLQETLKRRYETVPRVVVFLVTGKIPVEVMHSCDNRPCIAPWHLKDGTHLENLRDAAMKGRIRHGVDHRDTHLTEQDIHDIRRELAKVVGPDGQVPYGAFAALARRYGVVRATIGAIYHRRSWRGLAPGEG